jgi:hypothetical protein
MLFTGFFEQKNPVFPIDGSGFLAIALVAQLDRARLS